ncbi:MAG: 50S ribosomal protein L21 [Chloroflexota bacterium]|nr:50S ribosomal protein L21 [Chloroflexota bacterium]
MYAVVKTGGKQYKVRVGATVDVELLDTDVGDAVTFDRVLMVADGDDVQIGRPFLQDAKVSATVMDHGKGSKVIAFKYKPKNRYKRYKGHRQPYTRLHIDAIEI